MSGKTPYAQTARVLIILHELCSAGSPLSLGQLSDRLVKIGKGLSERTIYRDLEFLESNGYIFRKQGTKGYFIDYGLRFSLSKKLRQKKQKKLSNRPDAAKTQE